jgi:hypothetical protein
LVKGRSGRRGADCPSSSSCQVIESSEDAKNEKSVLMMQLYEKSIISLALIFFIHISFWFLIIWI